MSQESFEHGFQVIMMLLGALGALSVIILGWMGSSLQKVSERVAEMDTRLATYFTELTHEKERRAEQREEIYDLKERIEGCPKTGKVPQRPV